MAKLGKAIEWQDIAGATDWESLSDDQKATYIEMATPDDESIQVAVSVVVAELKPLLDATLKEDDSLA